MLCFMLRNVRYSGPESFVHFVQINFKLQTSVSWSVIIVYEKTFVVTQQSCGQHFIVQTLDLYLPILKVREIARERERARDQKAV